ncbi:MAG: glycerophosphodiester phosphodiesterase [Phycisphaerales bacterium]
MPHTETPFVHPVRTLVTSLRQMFAFAPVVIAYGALAGFVSAVILAPLMSWAAESLLGMSGRVAVSNLDLASFLFTPKGVAMLAGTGTLLVFAQLFDECLIYARLDLAGGNVFTPLLSVARASHRLLGAGLLQTLLLGAITLPQLALVWFLWKTFLHEHDINFYLANRPREFWIAVAIAVTGAIPTALLIFLALAATARMGPLIVLDELRVYPSFRESIRQFRATFRPTLETLGLHAIATLLVASAAAFILKEFTERVLIALPDRALLLALVAGALLITNGVVLALIGFLSTSTRAGAVWLIDGRHAGKALKPLDWSILPRLKLKLAFWVVGLAIFAGAEAWLLDRLSDRAHKLGTIQIVAHRGSSGRAPENSLAAFWLAIEDGADWVELDVQRSKDGQIVVLHDRDLFRVARDPRNVWDITAAELADVRIGGGHGPEFSIEHVPTFNEVLDLPRRTIGLMIELKYNRPDPELAPQLAARLKESKGRFCVVSLDAAGLAQIEKADPTLKTGLLVSASAGNLLGVSADFLAVNQSLATPWFLDRARSVDKPVYVWTINTEPEMLRLMSLGVSGIITDEPALAVRVRDKFRKMSVPDLIRLFVNSRLR